MLQNAVIFLTFLGDVSHTPTLRLLQTTHAVLEIRPAHRSSQGPPLPLPPLILRYVLGHYSRFQSITYNIIVCAWSVLQGVCALPAVWCSTAPLGGRSHSSDDDRVVRSLLGEAPPVPPLLAPPSEDFLGDVVTTGIVVLV